MYLLEFLVFSFLGWIIDSGYRSITEQRWINAGFFKGPICPIYGFGALVILFIFKYLSFIPPLLLILCASLGLVLVEYIGGIFTERVLKIKLWDYSSSQYHIGGHIDLLHSLYWVLLAILFSAFVYPYILIIEKIIIVPDYLELPSFFIFILVSLWITIRKIPMQFLEFKGKFMNITVEKYQKLFSTIHQFYKTTSSQKRNLLRKKIEQQLRNTGAYLKKIDFRKR